MWPFKNKISISRQPSDRSDDWPALDRGMQPIACWTNPDRTQRVFLVDRRDGMFSMLQEYYSVEEDMFGWHQTGSGASFYDSAETAIREINISFHWSRDVEPESRDVEPHI